MENGPAPTEQASAPEEERWFVKKPCQHCPFRRDVTPFLHPERAEDIANSALNPYSSFPCHKTTEYAEDEDGFGDMVAVASSLQCAGFLAMQINEAGAPCPDGFTPSELIYEYYEMIDAYVEQWRKHRPGYELYDDA